MDKVDFMARQEVRVVLVIAVLFMLFYIFSVRGVGTPSAYEHGAWGCCVRNCGNISEKFIPDPSGASKETYESCVARGIA